MGIIESIERQTREFIARVQGAELVNGPLDERLRAITMQLVVLARSPEWSCCGLPRALPGEELLYPLAFSTDDGPALYLVSDGASVVSQPHGHETWAVIVGILGREVNHLYTVQSVDQRIAIFQSIVKVGPGEALVLWPKDIHATEVRGEEATFHLHLYGRPLHTLRTFASRCYAVAPEA